ncbi:MAG: glycosyltransferase family A protein [Weeksellaceae bacterium]|nr:glycosyltransferase family A protein [Weeksellaceae bacterium]
MTHILIKSFNRPFYLDRCLQSIKRFVKGDYKIIVLDDGTPLKYLDKIRTKHTEVIIRLSEQHDFKVQSIKENLESGKEIDGFLIPTQLWYNAVKEASDYVLMIEDDVWFVESMDIELMITEMKTRNVDLLKVGQLRKPEHHQNQISENIYSETPKKLWTAPPMLMDWFMYNKFKFFSIMYRLGWVDNLTKREYWKLNSILMGLWRKEYWLWVWKDAKNKVDENMQLRNAALWYRKNKTNKNMIGRTSVNHLKTTFQSSATNSYHKYGVEFDVNYFNFLINEAWYKNEFDTCQNFPNDFSLEYFESFLDDKINKNEFHQWVEKFKNQYRKTGVETD